MQKNYLIVVNNLAQLLALVALLSFLAPVFVCAESLTVSYFERPPYYYTNEQGVAEGFLLQRARQIFQQADIEVKFLALTPYRILYVLEHATVPHCSIGWFKNSAREQFTKFSAPIYQNQALMLLSSKDQRHKFSSPSALREIFADRLLTLARMGEFSYGTYVDELLGVLAPKSIVLSGNQRGLLQAVVEQRAAYMLVAPEEVSMLARQSGLSAADLLLVPLSDVPAGNLRYLMCSPAVTDITMVKLNQAINELSQGWSQGK